jgi:penicillin amidase
MGRGGRLIGLVVLGAAALAACAPSAGRSTGFAGLTGAATITRDVWGVPHIRANTDLDAVYALGYAHAQDRLWQMELNRRVGAGRLSEILGRAALNQDRFLRTWGFYRAAQAALPSLEPRTLEYLRAYAAGVNAFISAGNLPLEFTLTGAKPEPWQPADSIVWAKMLAYDLSANWRDELENAGVVAKIGLEGLRALKPDYPRSGPTVVRLEDYAGAVNLPGLEGPRTEALTLSEVTRQALERVDAIARSLPSSGFDRDKGSNNWVVAGSRTVSGKPLLANDPHLDFSAPSLWYLADVKGGALSAIGATLPGLPAVVLGRNERVAWGATNVAPDTQDLFTLDLKDGAFQTPAGPVKLETRVETIKVGAGEEKITVRTAPGYGPVISDIGNTPNDNGRAVALRYVSLEPGDTTLDAFIGFNLAGNGAEFVQAARRYIAPQQNFVYADLNGTIGYIAPGKIPVRDWNGLLPASAAAGQNWRGYRAFEDLPQVVNPREGFIVTANNRTLPHQAAQAEYSTYTEPYRAQRIRERLLENPRQTVDSMKDIQADTLSVVARDLVPDLLALTPRSDAARRLQATVRGWDLRADLRSTGATAFAFYYRELTRIVSDELGADFKYFNEPVFLISALRDNSRFCLDAGDASVKSCADFRARALERGALALEAKLGSDPVQWRWERLHVALFDAVLGAAPIVGPLFNRELPTNGSILTVNVGAYNQDTFVQRSGPSYRAVYDLNALDASQYMHPMGQSGDVLSKHYDDFLRPWRDGQTIPMSQRAGDWGATTVTTLQP